MSRDESQVFSEYTESRTFGTDDGLYIKQKTKNLRITILSVRIFEKAKRIQKFRKNCVPIQRTMESFLSASKAALSNLSRYKRVRIVLGNGTCDLDSAVSALIQGFSEYLDGIKNKEMDLTVIPLMNIPEREYRVKTEVVYFFKRHNIPSSSLTFWDQIDLKALKEDTEKNLEVILVDHHNLRDEDIFLKDFVIEVIDHRPQDVRWPWPDRKVHLEIVGSCATLVAQNFLRKHPEMMDSCLSSLLRGPILIDTCNLSKEAGRATSIDVEIVEALEKIGCLDLDRHQVYNEILEAKSDISGLTPSDLLIRDLKITAGVPIVGMPILFENFLKLPDASATLRPFAESRSTTIVVLLGMEFKQETQFRDVAVFSINGDRLKQKIVDALTTASEPSLELTLTREIREENEKWNLLIYKQRNIRATRKHVLPIVRDTVLSQCDC